MQEAMQAATRSKSRFTRPVFLWPLIALLTEILVQWFLKHRASPSQLTLLSLLPLLPMVFFIWALARAIHKMDELQQRVCRESMSVAFLLTLVATLVFLGLERAGLGKAPWDDLGSLMLLLWGCSYVFMVRRYK